MCALEEMGSCLVYCRDTPYGDWQCVRNARYRHCIIVCVAFVRVLAREIGFSRVPLGTRWPAAKGLPPQRFSAKMFGIGFVFFYFFAIQRNGPSGRHPVQTEYLKNTFVLKCARSFRQRLDTFGRRNDNCNFVKDNFFMNFRWKVYPEI